MPSTEPKKLPRLVKCGSMWVRPDMVTSVHAYADLPRVTVHHEPGNCIHTIPCTSSDIALEVAQNIAVKINLALQETK